MRASFGFLARLAFVSAAVGTHVLACGHGSPPVVAMRPSPGADAGEPLATACLMVNVCSCNLGCAAIRLPRSQIAAGAHARIVRDPLTGEDAKIVEVVDAAGTTVLALTDLHHDYACSLTSRSPLLGYGCDATKSGPVPSKACAHGCD